MSIKSNFSILKNKTIFKSNSINIGLFYCNNLANNADYQQMNIYNNFDNILYNFKLLSDNFDQTTKNIIFEDINFNNILCGYAIDGNTNDKIPNTLIKIVKQDQTIYTTYTNNDGYFEIPNVLYGVYNIIAQKEQFFDGSIIYNCNSFLINQNHNHNVEIYLYPAVDNISGHVYDIDNTTTEILDSNVVLQNLKNTYRTTNTSTGFTINNILIDSYNISASNDPQWLQIPQSTKQLNMSTDSLENIKL